MTTIIVVAIVALVFFVSVCIITFMVWKRETELRTDSLKGIESGINEVLFELSGGGSSDRRRPRGGPAGNRNRWDNVQDEYNEYDEYDTYPKKSSMPRGKNFNRKYHNKKKDPFSWVREETRDYSRDEYSGAKVFRPIDYEPQRVKWTEISEEDIAENNVSGRIENGMRTETINSAETVDGAETGIRNESENNSESARIIENEKNAEESIETRQTSENKNIADSTDDENYGEINLDHIILDEFDDIFEDNSNDSKILSDTYEYDTGRSGRKYTAEELEALIKE